MGIDSVFPFQYKILCNCKLVCRVYMKNKLNFKCVLERKTIMNESEKIENNEVIACDVCMKEVPASEAKSEEASDYVRHFCGLDCYEKWSNQEKHENKSDE